MALIECPECGREVSSSAAACPACAYPVGTGTPAEPPRAVSRPPKRLWWKTTISIVGRLTVGAIMVAAGGDESEATIAAVIGGLIIGASAIPVFYRYRIERLKAGWGATTLDDRIEDRMVELEHRHREQIRQVDQMRAAEIAELEERIDFAERLLTKQREQIGPG